MRRRALYRTLAGLTLTLTVLATGAVYLILHEPASYRRMTVPDGPERRKLSGEFMTGLNDLQDSFNNAGNASWQETFSAEQMNSYFAEDFLRARPFKLPDGVDSPRVSIEPGHFRIAFRYGRGFWSSVVSIDLNCWLVGMEPNVVAVEVLGLHAGSVPLSVQTWLQEITEAARDWKVEVTWYRHEGHPVALLRFEADKDHPSVLLQRLELEDGKLIIAGRSSDPSGLRAMLTSMDVGKPQPGDAHPANSPHPLGN
jgi:hypothetical protein